MLKIKKLTAEWCGPCRAIDRLLDPYVEKGLVYDKIDIESEEGIELTQKHNVRGIPYFIDGETGEPMNLDYMGVYKLVTEEYGRI